MLIIGSQPGSCPFRMQKSGVFMEPSVICHSSHLIDFCSHFYAFSVKKLRFSLQARGSIFVWTLVCIPVNKIVCPFIITSGSESPYSQPITFMLSQMPQPGGEYHQLYIAEDILLNLPSTLFIVFVLVTVLGQPDIGL